MKVHKNDTIVSVGGTLRPWESAVNGFALIQYLIGLRLDMPNKKIYLQPHLPEGWNHWKTKEFPLYKEGKIQIELTKNGKEIVCLVKRKGGQNHIEIDIEFGLFSERLKSMDKKLKYKNDKQDILFANEVIEASKDWVTYEFRFEID